MTNPKTSRPASLIAYRVSPSDLHLPPTEPIDITAIIAAELAARPPHDCVEE
ncbi:hypothetical protein [Microbacterium sp. TNHR37B]|uniref:hypothetical protein n=1 Tax=Microbacterium sp. TNHR37B TaxID=1775956 RepID=UPI0007B1A849|nr:hypothetical protein [Microbacterium sp. TNHR37B]KZE89433.1 hypothetical protein AVP41_02227 [Microbacterium sp. TNHR37B]